MLKRHREPSPMRRAPDPSAGLSPNDARATDTRYSVRLGLHLSHSILSPSVAARRTSTLIFFRLRCPKRQLRVLVQVKLIGWQDTVGDARRVLCKGNGDACDQRASDQPCNAGGKNEVHDSRRGGATARVARNTAEISAWTADKIVHPRRRSLPIFTGRHAEFL
jgi:hypothetical protein